jgi:DNA-directed RNA polymerase subunit beta'
MNRMRIAATSRDAALRAQHRRIQESLILPNSSEEEHAAELAQGPEAAIGDDPLAPVTRPATAPTPMPASICRAKGIPSK